MPMLIQLALALLLTVQATPSSSDRETAAVQAAVQEVTAREFAAPSAQKRPPVKRSIHFVTKSASVSAPVLETLRLYPTSRGWPPDGVERLREANRKGTTFDKTVLDGMTVSSTAANEVRASAPGFTSNGDAILYVSFRATAMHGWLIWLSRDGDRWRVADARLILAS